MSNLAVAPPRDTRDCSQGRGQLSSFNGSYAGLPVGRYYPDFLVVHCLHLGQVCFSSRAFLLLLELAFEVVCLFNPPRFGDCV